MCLRSRNRRIGGKLPNISFIIRVHCPCLVLSTTLLYFNVCSLFTKVWVLKKWWFPSLLEIDWKREWFPGVAKYPKVYWNFVDNCRSFIEMIANCANIKSSSDWRKVSFSLIRHKGGTVIVFLKSLRDKGLLQKYEGSIKSILKSIYPAENWEGMVVRTGTTQMVTFWKRKLKKQHLQRYIKEVFGSENVLVNHRKYKT